MEDIHTRFLKELSEEIISKLEGSHCSQKHFQSPDPPCKTIILGSLADISNHDSQTKSSTDNSSLSLKFQTYDDISLNVDLLFSVFVREKINPGDMSPRDKATEGFISWNRIDFVESHCLSLNTPVSNVKFNNHVPDSYTAELTYRSFKKNNVTHIEITVSNTSREKDQYLFNVEMNIHLNSSSIIPYVYGYMYEDQAKNIEPNPLFRTVNCCAYYDDDKSQVYVGNNSKFIQYKMAPRIEDQGLFLRFDELSTEDCVTILQKHLIILTEYSKRYHLASASFTDEQIKLMNNFDSLCNNYEKGIELILSNKNVKTAFMLMNSAFDRSNESYKNWRLFQLTYIVSTLPSIVDPSNARETCDVIHVSTGGGKTETYLGLIVFSIFYDRLIGKETGVSAIVKFPLRMLSIQQLQRTSKVIVTAEEIRQEQKIPGEPLSISFFVGNSSDFPNDIEEAIKNIESGVTPGKLLKNCPVCNSEIVLEVEKNNTIVHKCNNSQCEKRYRLYYTDSEVYRFLPSVIVSTVDKFSAVANNRRMKNIFGAKTDICPNGHGHVCKNDKCDICNTRGVPHKQSCTTPSLVIQDELHLIRESFGTIDSHFESVCYELQRELKGTVPKHIALTATVTGCSEQIRQLYNQDVKIFPGKNPTAYADNPFFFNEKHDDHQKIHRIIIGMKPNGRDNQYASLLTIKYISEFIAETESKLDEKCIEYCCTKREFEDLIAYHNRLLTYHGKIADVYSMNHLLDTVVNSSKETYYVKGHPLTGEKSTQEISDIIKSITEFTSHDKYGIHATFSTSVVSHGVDIEKWNIMEFQGIPNNTAEYIQAMSRVGRRYPGLVIIWFYPNRVRDLSFYNHFLEYHSMLEDRIEPVSINKWTELSLKETITSVFNAAILNFMSAKLERPIYKKDDVTSFFKNNENNKAMLIEFIKRVYHVDDDVKGADFFNTNIPIMVEDRLKYIWSFYGSNSELNFFPNILERNNDDKYYRTPAGMRGIQDNVMFSASSGTKIFLANRRGGKNGR